MPAAVRVAVLVNPTNVANTETTLREVEMAGRAIGLKSRSSARAPVARSMRSLPLLCASGLTLSLSRLMASSQTGESN